MNTLINDTIDLAEVETQNEFLNKELVDLSKVVKRCKEVYEGLSTEHEVKMIYELASSEFKVIADDYAVQKVLDNLVTNAVCYTPKDGKVIVKTYQEGESGVLEVTDSGIGIPLNEQEDIFKRFYKIDKGRAREHKLDGSGLGLSIVKYLVTGMKGEIKLSSREGKGSQFKIYLPIS